MDASTRITGRIAITLLTAILTCGAPGALAYQQGGHLLTAYVAAHYVEDSRTGNPVYSDDDAVLIAFCAQLPDQSVDLDALKAYKAVWTSNPIDWTVLNRTDSITTRRMITVQQLQHALTGGSSAQMQAVASGTLQQLAANAATATPGKPRDRALCALGFGLHLYGDSFAHVDFSDDTVMSDTGRGHGFQGVHPDTPLWLPSYLRPSRYLTSAKHRFGVWEEYWPMAAQDITPQPAASTVPLANRQQLNDLIYKECRQGNPARYASPSNFDSMAEHDEACFEQILLSQATAMSPVTQFFDTHRSTEPCETVMTAALTQGPLRTQGRQVNCLSAWKAFCKVIKPKMESTPGIRETLGRVDFNSAYLDDPFSGPTSFANTPDCSSIPD